MRWLNPLQWNFGPRTVATLLTWAVVPVLVASLAVRSALVSGGATLGLTAAQVTDLLGRLVIDVTYVLVPTLVLCGIAAIIFTRVVVGPLWKLREAMEQIARGDLSHGAVPVKSPDEVGQITQSFNAMASGLRSMVADLAVNAAELSEAGRRLEADASHTARATQSSESVVEKLRSTAEGQAEKAAGGARAMEELRQAATQVSQSAEAQSREVTDAAVIASQVATAVEQVAGSTGVVSEAAQNTRVAAEAGGQAVQAVEKSMEQVRRRVFEAADQLRRLSDSLTHVDEILQLITDISEQTDLLALNAAIEAARVGEHGRGFAVVAGEVRRLADRSRTAAGDISARVDELRSGAQSVVTTMELGTQEVQEGAVLARDAGTSLDRILKAVAETQGQVESISAAAEEIAAASNQVVLATNSLSAIAEENAAVSEEMLASAQVVTGLVADVDREAKEGQEAAAALAAASVQVHSAVGEMVACASQIAATSTKLREHVSRFRLE